MFNPAKCLKWLSPVRSTCSSGFFVAFHIHVFVNWFVILLVSSFELFHVGPSIAEISVFLIIKGRNIDYPLNLIFGEYLSYKQSYHIFFLFLLLSFIKFETVNYKCWILNVKLSILNYDLKFSFNFYVNFKTINREYWYSSLMFPALFHFGNLRSERIFVEM